MTKKRILDVATEEFATLGYSGLSMNKLEIGRAHV